MRVPRPRLPLSCAAAAIAALVAGAPARADTVVADDHVVQGKACIGALCADGEAFASPVLRLKVADTPAISLMQMGGGGFDPQTWDVGGNEANFFVRDLTGGSRLPLRIRPGAPTNGLDIRANGEVESVGVLVQQAGAMTFGADADGSAILTALRTLPFKRYTLNPDPGNTPHLTPAPSSFRSAFGLGGRDDLIAAADVAAVALAAVKALDARVSTLSMTPGPQGAPGAPGPAGSAGAAGPTVDLAASNRRIAKLEAANRRLAKDLAALRRQVRRARPRR